MWCGEKLLEESGSYVIEFIKKCIAFDQTLFAN